MIMIFGIINGDDLCIAIDPPFSFRVFLRECSALKIRDGSERRCLTEADKLKLTIAIRYPVTYNIDEILEGSRRYMDGCGFETD